ncbi:MAG: hypothetical protein GWP91_25620, partial [Rhodobacterales bacterium]|nr:hypothetical protein [Rhodobacterales bacterium]
TTGTTTGTTATQSNIQTTNANCQQRVESDNTGNGAVDYVFTLFYDDRELPFMGEADYYADGGVNERWEYTYDANDQLILTTTDTTDDGVPNSAISVEYNADGNVSARRTDSNGDGTIETYVAYTYDAEQRVAFVYYDYSENGNVGLTWEYQYSGPGSRDGLVVQYFPDDVVRFRSVYTYDGDLLLTQVDDVGANGIINLAIDQTWTSDGRPTERVEVGFALDGAEGRTVASTWTYDPVVDHRIDRIDHHHSDPQGVQQDTFDDHSWTCP